MSYKEERLTEGEIRSLLKRLREIPLLPRDHSFPKRTNEDYDLTV